MYNKDKFDPLVSDLIIYACENSLVEMVDDLITAKVNLDVKRNDYKTPLMIACENNSTIAMKLIDAGANVNLIDVCTGENALLIACDNKMTDVSLRLLDLTNDLNWRNYQGVNALMKAAYVNHEPVFIKLVDKGIDFYQANNFSLTALFYLYKFKHTRLIKYLQFSYKKSILELLTKYKTPIVKSFLNPIADLNVLDILCEYIL